MRMNVFEMEGFLRGRCVPRDLKVNETDAEYLVRKFDALEAKCAAQENKVIPVSTELPPANESVLLFDANGEGWLIGWRSLWYTWGQKETGEWQWTFQVGDLENVNITKRFGDLVDRRRAKNGDNEYMAWDMTLGWIVWQQRAGIHFSTMSQQEVK